MKKKVIPLLLSVFVFLTPLKPVFAYTNGLTNGDYWYRSNNPTGSEYRLSDNVISQFISGYSNTYFEYNFLNRKGALATINSYINRSENNKVRIDFYGNDGSLIRSITNPNNTLVKTTVDPPIYNVARVRVVNLSTSTQLWWEFDLFGSLTVPPLGGLLDGNLVFYGNNIDSNANSTALLTNNINTDGINFNSNNHAIWYSFDSPMEINKIYTQGELSEGNYDWKFYGLNNTLLKTIPWTKNDWVEIEPVKHVRKVALTSKVESDVKINEMNVLGFSIPPIEHTELSSLNLISSDKSVGITWEIPLNHPEFTGTAIYRDGEFLTSVNSNTSTFSDILVEPEKTYEYRVSAIYLDGYGTTGITKSVTTLPTPKPIEEVNDVKVQTFYNRVNLSWDLPTTEKLSHVNIYREKMIKPTSFMEQMMFGSKVYAASTKIFETNGTYFNDLTVESDSTYEYTLTTQNIEGKESQGISVLATTPPAPIPEMGGEEVITDENGDYKVTWTSPTTGKVKILIDGSEYAVVDASLGEYTIPVVDMEYDLFGKPKVQLVPISTTGKEGQPTKPPVNGEAPGTTGVTLPFTANDFLKTVMSLIAWVGPFILLVLTIYFAPRIIQFLKGVITKYREGKFRL